MEKAEKKEFSTCSVQTDNTAQCNAETQALADMVDKNIIFSRWKINNVTYTKMRFSKPTNFVRVEGSYEGGKAVQVNSKNFSKNRLTQTPKEFMIERNIEREIEKKKAEIQFLQKLKKQHKRRTTITVANAQKKQKIEEVVNPIPDEGGDQAYDHEALDALFEELDHPKDASTSTWSDIDEEQEEWLLQEL